MREGKWKAATRKEIEEQKKNERVRNGEFREPGPSVEAIEQVYGALADIWETESLSLCAGPLSTRALLSRPARPNTLRFNWRTFIFCLI